MALTVPLTEAKARLPQLIRELEELGEQVVITRSGRPAGILLGIDEYEGLLETLDILADPELTGQIRESLEELAKGEGLSHDEVWGDLDSTLRS